MEFRCLEVRHVQADHDLRCLAEPPTGRRARDPEIRGDGHVPGALDEIPKPVVVALLKAARGRHGDDHRPFAYAAQLLEDDWERPLMRRSATVTTTRARTCRMSVETARFASTRARREASAPDVRSAVELRCRCQGTWPVVFVPKTPNAVLPGCVRGRRTSRVAGPW